MSDYGCIITFKKRSGNLSNSNKQAITNKLNELIPDSDYSYMIQEGDYETFYDWGEGIECIRLTEYYFDDDEDEIAEFAEEEDLPDAEDIVEKLNQVFMNDIEIKALFTSW